MKRVFADTLYWIACILKSDSWHIAALDSAAALGTSVLIVTTEEVLTELLTSFSERGPYWREKAAQLVRSTMANQKILVLPQSHQSFISGLALYESRQDKGYSLVDCISMQAMRELSITEVLTNDRHFSQEGFATLIS